MTIFRDRKRRSGTKRVRKIIKYASDNSTGAGIIFGNQLLPLD